MKRISLEQDFPLTWSAETNEDNRDFFYENAKVEQPTASLEAMKSGSEQQDEEPSQSDQLEGKMVLWEHSMMQF